MVRMALNFIVIAMVARYLGKGSFGILMYAFGFTALFCGFASIGIDNILMQEIASKPSEANRYLGSAWLIKIIGAVICVLVTCLIAILFEPDSTARLLIYMLSLSAVFQSVNVIQFFFEAEVAARYVVWLEVAQSVIFGGLRGVLIWCGCSVEWFGLSMLLEPAFMAVALIWSYVKTGHTISAWRVDREVIAGLIKRGAPMALAGIAALIYLRTDVIMLRYMVGEDSVGVYAAAARLCALAAFPALQITRALSPALIDGYRQSNTIFKKRYQLFVDLIFWLSSVVAFLLFAGAPIFMLLFFGHEYQAGTQVVRIMVWKGIFAALGFATGQWIIICNFHKMAPIRSVTGALINIVLNLILIPRYGATGAAIASVLAFAVSAFFINAIVPTLRPVFLYEISAVTGGLGRLIRFQLNRSGKDIR